MRTVGQRIASLVTVIIFLWILSIILRRVWIVIWVQTPLVGAGVDRSDPVPGDRLSGSSRIRRKALIPVPLNPLVFRISWRMSELLLCGAAKDTRVV